MKKFTFSLLLLCLTVSLFATEIILTPATPITHSLDGSVTIYDDGGKDAGVDYAVSSESFLTLTPVHANATISFELQSLDLGAYTFIYLYNGTDDSGISVKKIGNSQALGFVYESNTPGAPITLKFKTNKYAGEGFKLKAEEIVHTPIVLDSFDATPSTGLKLTKGNQNIAMMSLNALTSGDLNSKTISHIKINTAGTTANTLAKASLYYSNTSNTFATDVVMASVDNPTGIIDFDCSQIISTPGSHYFWISYDILSNAPSLATVEAQLQAYSVDDIETVVTNAPLVSTQLVDALHGTYQIGTSPQADYATLTAALTELHTKGIEASTTFKLEAGTYDTDLSLSSISGTSSTQTITFESLDPTNKATINATTALASSSTSMATLNDVNYILFNNIEFENDQEWKSLLNIENGTHHITFDNCEFTMGNENTRGISSTVEQIGQELNTISISNTTFEGGKNGISIFGANDFTNASTAMSQNLTIDQCTFNNQHSVGLYIRYFTNVTINNCTITNLVGSTYRRGIYMDATDQSSISNCSITVDGTSAPKYINGIYFAKSAQYVTQGTRVFNNTIFLTNFATAKSGIYFGSDTKKIDFAYNSVRMEGTGSARILSYYKIGSGHKVRNNILQQMGTGLVQRFSYSYDASDVDFSNNIYFSNGSDLAYVGSANAHLDMDAWNGLMNETNSQNSIVAFTGPTDLHLTSVDQLINADAISDITVDKDGVTRADPLTCGAFQFIPETDPTANNNTFENDTRIWSQNQLLNIETNQEVLSIYVYNTNGQLVHQSSNNKLSIELNKGIYLVCVNYTNQTQEVQKISL